MAKKQFNPEFWLHKSKQPEPQPIQPRQDSADDVEIITRRIEDAGIDITDTYASWRDLGFALSEQFGEGGRSLFHRLSRFHPEYNPAEADKQYDHCLHAGGSGITIKTLFQLAKDHGISLTTTPLRIKSRISSNSYDSSAAEIKETEEMKETEPLPTFSDRISGNLPYFLQKVAEKGDKPDETDILILGAVTVVSACLPNIHGEYDGLEVFPNLFLFVTAQASAGKGRLNLCRNIALPIHHHLRDLYDAAKMDYEEKMRQYEINKKKGTVEKPQKPALTMLLIPANTSATAVYQILADNDEKGLIFETEGDTLANSFASDYGNFSDGFRKFFHHEPASYHRRGGDEHVDLEHPQVSAVLSGTPEQVRSLIKSPENGLFSRFIFYHLDSKLIWKNVFAQRGDGNLIQYFNSLGEEYFSFYQQLEGLQNPLPFYFTEPQQEQFNTTFESCQASLYEVFGNDIIPSVRRLGLITYRIAMVLTALRIMEDGDFYTDLVCSDEDFNTAITISEVLIRHTVYVYETLFKPADNAPRISGEQSAIKERFFDALPAEFTRQDYLTVAQSIGLKPKTAENYISKFLATKLIRRLEHGKYGKTS